MKENYPLIDLIKSEQPPFWVYNNYAYMYYSYLESLKKDPKYYNMGDYQDKPKLDESLQIKLSSNPNLKGIYFIENEIFEWVEQYYYKHYAELEFLFVYNWNNSVYTINCFSALYDLKGNEIPWENDEISNIEIYDFKNAGLYPDNKKLDSLVKEKLKNIEFEWIENFMNGQINYPSKIYKFFDFHLNNYDGDPHVFVYHSIELINDIWGFKNVMNIKRTKCFDRWIEDIIQKYNLDRSKLGLEPVTTPEPPQQQNENIMQPLVKIRWNAPKNVLTSIFVQLKQMNTNQNNPVIDNSYEDIAVFLKTNFDCYQDTEISTITTTLKNQSSGNSTPKQSKLIEIRKSDL